MNLWPITPKSFWSGGEGGPSAVYVWEKIFALFLTIEQVQLKNSCSYYRVRERMDLKYVPLGIVRLRILESKITGLNLVLHILVHVCTNRILQKEGK